MARTSSGCCGSRSATRRANFSSRPGMAASTAAVRALAVLASTRAKRLACSSAIFCSYVSSARSFWAFSSMALTSARLTRRPSSTVSSRMTSASLMSGRLLLAGVDGDQVLGADDVRLGHVAVQDVEDEGLALLAADDRGQALEALVRHAAVLARLE